MSRIKQVLKSKDTLFLTSIILLLVLATSIGLNVESESKPEKTKIQIGGTYELTGAGGVPVSKTLETYDKATEYVISGDTLGYQNLKLSGDVFTVQSGTSVTVIDSKISKIEVRVLEGTHQGKSGWVLYDWIR